MGWNQNVTPNLDPYVYTAEYKNGTEPLPDWYGWCLATVRAAFGSPYSGGTAWVGWTQYTQIKHQDRNFPVGVYFPIWFSGFGGYGHVAFAYVHPGGSMSIWTSPYKHVPYFFTGYTSVDQLAQGYGLVYVGWSEDIAGQRIVSYTPDAPPPPPPAQHPYTVEAIASKVVANAGNQPHQLWNLDATNWGDFSAVSTLEAYSTATVSGIAHHNLGGTYYMPDINQPYGYNVVDMVDYVAPPMESPPIPEGNSNDNEGEGDDSATQPPQDDTDTQTEQDPGETQTPETPTVPEEGTDSPEGTGSTPAPTVPGGQIEKNVMQRIIEVLAKFTPYSKFLVALLGAVVTVVVQFYSNSSAVQAVVAVLTALSVYQVPNRGVRE